MRSTQNSRLRRVEGHGSFTSDDSGSSKSSPTEANSPFASTQDVTLANVYSKNIIRDGRSEEWACERSGDGEEGVGQCLDNAGRWGS